ncbi:tryptophan--tRNA ligase [Vallitalea okinawensis]|uniref:tryptophan--tRNA ligase n=1 Tax=Vallitalea okinawensis TaxID=2078660 RepID=UPI000CFCAD2F|nr:tryptophan--tRNA ligase [Vallitalea okinawensis]
MKQHKTYLTGIKPTGIAHIGNYLGAIKPALEKISHNKDERHIYFIADYHALNLIKDRNLLKKYTYSIAATWLALGLDPNRVIFYKQSDIPEIFELSSILACMTPKGLMNRAHAYKAKVSENIKKKIDPDTDVNMGLYTYPILMSADILLFNTDVVPVGKDQVQHVEIARDIAENFNKTFGNTFSLPKYVLNKETAIITGSDGRKMSKSYHNTLEIFETEKVLKKYVYSMKTDSSLPTDPKDPDNSNLFSMYKQFATQDEINDLRERYHQGIGWGEVKRILFNKINDYLEEPRESYKNYTDKTWLIDEFLEKGRHEARQLAKPFLEEIKSKIGVG